MNKDTTNLANIWSKPAYLPYVQPPLTDEVLHSAEMKLGYSLPEELIALLRVQNGGSIRYTLPDTGHGTISGIGPHFPSLLEFDHLSEYNDLSFETKGLIPFDGDGHWEICLDYRENRKSPRVSFIDLECDRQRVIADSFSEYLTQLTIEPDASYVIETDKPIDKFVAGVSKITGINFEEPDTFAHGYASYRGKFMDEWIWISPNQVLTGFVRQNHERYEELKSLMKGTGLRYPEIPANSVFLFSHDEKTRTLLRNRLLEQGMDVNTFDSYF